MIIAHMLMLFMTSMLTAGPVPAMHQELFESHSGPADVFELPDDQVPAKLPDTYSPLVTYLRMLGLKLVMAYYDFASWLSVQRDSILASLKTLFGNTPAHSINTVEVPSPAGSPDE